MSLSNEELVAVLVELRTVLVGRNVKKIYQPTPEEIFIKFRGEKGMCLLANIHPQYGRICLANTEAEMRENPSSFALQLRKYLTGKKLAGIDKKPGDRAIRLRFAGNFLYCQLYAPRGFFLTTEEDKVIGSSPNRNIGAPEPSIGFPGFCSNSQEGEYCAVYDGSPSECIERKYSAITKSALFEEKKSIMLKASRLSLKRLRKLIASMEADRLNLARYEQYGRWGDLCSIHFPEIRKGMDQIGLIDPSNGEQVNIPLSPELRPSENLQLLYKKHRKFRSGMEKVSKAITSVLEELDEKVKLIALIEKISTAEELDNLGKDENAIFPGLRVREGGEQEPSRPRRFISPEGYEIFVGRNDRQNDDLVRKSNGNDFWFHVRDFPGSHVVIRTGKKTDIPAGTIMAAANLALKYSSRAKDGKGLVVYTYVKNIKKPKHSAPGKVIVTREKTVYANLENEITGLRK